MEITTTEAYFLITSTEDSFDVFFENYNLQKTDFEKNHTIIQLSENLNTTIKQLSLFLDIAATYRSNGMSFVVICNGIDIDDVPDEINIVPTFTEAEDVLEMEAIERDLGF
ncbi:MAG: hypothetical protein HWD85_00260 [Flavobacteriaceae bacterium]|nr:hypothetical protein [Flavobacteriaceae bacterium]